MLCDQAGIPDRLLTMHREHAGVFVFCEIVRDA